MNTYYMPDIVPIISCIKIIILTQAHVTGTIVNAILQLRKLKGSFSSVPRFTRI